MSQNVNRCQNAKYDTRVATKAVNPITGVPKGCKDTDLVTFGWDVPTAAPTPGPSAIHNPASCSPSVDQPSTPTPPTPPTNAPTPTLAPVVHNPASCSPSAESVRTNPPTNPPSA